MATLLYRIGRFAFGRRGVVASAWFVLLAVARRGAAGLGSAPTSSVTIPGTESQRALEALAQEFPQASGASGTVVVRAPEGQTVVAPASKAVVDDVVARACEGPRRRRRAEPVRHQGDQPGRALRPRHRAVRHRRPTS